MKEIKTVEEKATANFEILKTAVEEEAKHFEEFQHQVVQQQQEIKAASAGTTGHLKDHLETLAGRMEWLLDQGGLQETIEEKVEPVTTEITKDYQAQIDKLEAEVQQVSLHVSFVYTLVP